VEVNISKEDVSLIRGLAAASSDRARRAETRKLLAQCVNQPSKTSLKALLASAPFDGINLDRNASTGALVMAK
jgi:hypothetical protein